MKRTFIIGKYTFIDLFKSRITLNVAILGLVLCVISYISYSFTYGVPQKVALDVGLGLLSLSSVAVALFLGASLLSNEIESRTVYVVLSRSVSRFQFLMGKLIGLSAILSLNIFILCLFIFGLFILLGGSLNSLLLWNVVFTILEALLVMLITVILSLATNKVVTILVSISLYVIGHAVNPQTMVAVLKQAPGLENIIEVINWFVPNFYKLNLKDLVLYQQNLETSYLVGTSAYALGYCIVLIIASLWIFKRKNLD